MAKDQIITEEHHRRCRSLDGGDGPANKSYVRSRLHRCWHILFGNKNAYQICDWLDNSCIYKPQNVLIICEFINGTEVTKKGENSSKKRSKISYAWITLFEGLEFDEIIKYINNVWLDPSYHFYIKEIEL